MVTRRLVSSLLCACFVYTSCAPSAEGRYRPSRAGWGQKMMSFGKSALDSAQRLGSDIKNATKSGVQRLVDVYNGAAGTQKKYEKDARILEQAGKVQEAEEMKQKAVRAKERLEKLHQKVMKAVKADDGEAVATEVVNEQEESAATKMQALFRARRARKEAAQLKEQVVAIQAGDVRRDMLERIAATYKGSRSLFECESLLRGFRQSCAREYSVLYGMLFGYDYVDTTRVYQVRGDDAARMTAGECSEYVLKRLCDKYWYRYDEVREQDAQAHAIDALAREQGIEPGDITAENRTNLIAQWRQNKKEKTERMQQIYKEVSSSAHDAACSYVSDYMRRMKHALFALVTSLEPLRTSDSVFGVPQSASDNALSVAAYQSLIAGCAAQLSHLIIVGIGGKTEIPSPDPSQLQEILFASFTHAHDAGVISKDIPGGSAGVVAIKKQGFLSRGVSYMRGKKSEITNDDVIRRRSFEVRWLASLAGFPHYNWVEYQADRDVMKKDDPGIESSKQVLEEVHKNISLLAFAHWRGKQSVKELHALISSQKKLRDILIGFARKIGFTKEISIQDPTSRSTLYRHIVDQVVVWKANMHVGWDTPKKWSELLRGHKISSNQQPNIIRSLHTFVLLSLAVRVERDLQLLRAHAHVDAVEREGAGAGAGASAAVDHPKRKIVSLIDARLPEKKGPSGPSLTDKVKDATSDVVAQLRDVVGTVGDEQKALAHETLEKIKSGDLKATVDRLNQFIDTLKRQLPRIQAVMVTMQGKTAELYQDLQRATSDKFQKILNISKATNDLMGVIVEESEEKLAAVQGVLAQVSESMLARFGTWAFSKVAGGKVAKWQDSLTNNVANTKRDMALRRVVKAFKDLGTSAPELTRGA